MPEPGADKNWLKIPGSYVEPIPTKVLRKYYEAYYCRGLIKHCIYAIEKKFVDIWRSTSSLLSGKAGKYSWGSDSSNFQISQLCPTVLPVQLF